MNEDETYRELDDAISAHVKASGNEDVFTTGWILVVSASSVQHQIGEQDGYVTYTSEGLPHHTQVGLLTIANDDKKNLGLIATLDSLLALRQQQEEDDE
jgi:hypothetical protein